MKILYKEEIDTNSREQNAHLISATCLNIGLLAVMYLWVPSEEYAYIIFILAGCWGTADAIWQTQTCSEYPLELPFDFLWGD